VKDPIGNECGYHLPISIPREYMPLRIGGLLVGKAHLHRAEVPNRVAHIDMGYIVTNFGSGLCGNSRHHGCGELKGGTFEYSYAIRNVIVPELSFEIIRGARGKSGE
jgi:hypothetical protein